jgi:hypothetical protein
MGTKHQNYPYEIAIWEEMPNQQTPDDHRQILTTLLVEKTIQDVSFSFRFHHPSS